MIPLILIPGMMCDARMWGGFAPDSHPVIHALPTGHGTMAALADAILARAPPRFALAGLSLGGIVAMEILAKAPDRVDRLALLDTNPLAELAEVKARRGPQIDKVKAGKLDLVIRDEMKPGYFATGTRREPLLDLCMDMARALGPDVFVRQSLALRDRFDRQAALAAYGGPALVLMGEEDRLCPRERHELMHGLMPQSRFVMVPGAGHLPTLEQPHLTSAHLIDWLSMPAQDRHDQGSP